MKLGRIRKQTNKKKLIKERNIKKTVFSTNNSVSGQGSSHNQNRAKR